MLPKIAFTITNESPWVISIVLDNSSAKSAFVIASMLPPLQNRGSTLPSRFRAIGTKSKWPWARIAQGVQPLRPGVAALSWAAPILTRRMESK